jgi:hypothetical protein
MTKTLTATKLIYALQCLSRSASLKSHVQHANQQHITNHAAVTTTLEAQAHFELSLFLRDPILSMTHEDGTYTNPRTGGESMLQDFLCLPNLL